MPNYDFFNLKVLICDDSRQIRALLKNFLIGFGFQDIIETMDAETAFAELLEMDPDLVITDWNMPTTNGIDLVRHIRQSPDSPNPYVPIIMLTGYTELDRVKVARDSGVSSFLAKPVSADSLYKRLVSLIEDRRLFVRTDDFIGPDRRFKSGEFEGPERRQ
ncbi:MAG: response regulator [Rhodospirillales bacterium]|nr:response regulator [Alphaproteobacteria bacterium]MBL6948570.1 response regulator [Rhodospirillales bacterium]